MKIYFTFLILFFGISHQAQNIQNKGMPYIQTYLPQDYGNHGKIWDISSAKNGLVYMASENGLLEFDGKTWRQFRDYKGYTRSLNIANDSTIFVGADMDFGVWKKNKFNNFSYTSLYPFHKNIKDVNEEFWDTYKIGEKMVFVSHQNIYSYYNKKVSVISAPTRFSESFDVNGRIFLADEKNGLYEYDGEKIKLLFSYPQNISLDIVGVFSEKGILHIVTKNKGIFLYSSGKISLFQSPITEEIIKNKVFSIANIENKYWAFGTILNGLYITDLQGNIIQHFNKNKGLPNNTILSLYYPKNGKLWVGLDYGICAVDIKSNITYFQSLNNDFGTGYASVLKNGTFYLGTNQGLYSAKWDNINSADANPFSLIGGTEGQVWTLQNIDDKILFGHDKGLFQVDGNVVSVVHNEPGITCLLKYQDNYLFAGTYSGISIFERREGKWIFLKKMKSILGMVNQIVQEDNEIFWINIPNYGIMRFKLNKDLEPEKRNLYNQKQFKGSFPYLFKEKEKICVITDISLYSFLPIKNHFIKEMYRPENHLKNLFQGFFKPIVLNSEYGFYSINNGFALERIDNNDQNFNPESNLTFQKIEAFNNENVLELYNGQKIEYRYNNLRFSFILPNEESVQYQYFLDGYSEKWSVISNKNTAEFLGLKEGDYYFQVRIVRNGKTSNIKKFKFVISPPWYRSIGGYLSYIMIIGTISFFLRKHHKEKLKKQKAELHKKQQASFQKQAELHEQELIIEKQKQLEYEKEKLREEIRTKTIELAVKAKDDEDKNRILQIIHEKIAEAENNSNISKIRLGEIKRMLKSYLVTDDHTFEIQMDELHQEFFKAIKKRFSNLSIYELRLCVFLKIGLSSKEIAEILHVLPSSINVSRSRLRRKLGLKSEDDLFKFLNTI